VSNDAHTYPNIEESSEDESSYLSLLDKELKQHHPSTPKLKDLMKNSFSIRRRWIVDDAESAKDVWGKYPLLKKSIFVSTHSSQYF
jgi:hypothetical protein